MRHSFQSRSLFLEARILRFANAGDTPKSQPKPDPVEKQDPAAMLDEFRDMEKEGLTGAEKVRELNQKVKQVEADCKALLQQIEERAGNSPRWKNMYDRYRAEMKNIHLTSPDAQTKIDGLIASMGRLGDELKAATIQPRELLEDKQRQEFDNLFNTTRAMVDAIRDGTSDNVEENFRRVNELLGGADPAVRDALFKQYNVRREGTVVKAKDGSSYSFTISENNTLQYEKLVPETSVEQAKPAEAKPEVNNDAMKPRELLEDKQRQEFDNLYKTTRTMVDAIRNGTSDDVEENLRLVNELLGGADPAVRDALFKQYNVRRDGTVVNAKDGSRYIFTVSENNTLQYELLAPAAKEEEEKPAETKPEVKNEENQPKKKTDPTAPEKVDDAPQQTTEQFIAEIKDKLSTILERVGIDAERIGDLVKKFITVVEKHAETLQEASDAEFTAENAESIIQQQDLPAVIAKIQEIGPENGWSAELTSGMCTFYNDLFEAFMSIVDEEEKKDEKVPAVPGEKPADDVVPAAPDVPTEQSKDIVESAGSAVDRLREGMNKPKEMTEEEKTSIIDAGKKILVEYKKIDKPTKAQSEQARGQLMMAGVDTTAGVDALAKNPDGVKAKEGTEFQVTMNKVMGFVIYIMSIVQEMKDTVKGAENEKKEGEKKDNKKVEGEEKPEDTDEAAPEQTREEALEAAKNKTDSAIVNADASVDLEDAARRSLIEDAQTAIGEEIALMNEGELSSEEQVKRMGDLENKKELYTAELKALEGDAEEPEAEPEPPVEDEQPEEDVEPPVEEDGEQPEEETDSIENLQQQSTDLQSQLDALDDKKAEDLTDEELDQVKQLRKEKAAIDAKIAEIDAGQ